MGVDKMHVGLDIHKRFTYATILDEEGNTMFEERFNNKPEEIENFKNKLDVGSNIVLEACNSWQYMYDYFDGQGFATKLAHPLKTSTLVGFFCKTDKIDSKNLAELSRLNKVPMSYVPDMKVRDLRTLARHRASLVSLRTQVKNKIHAILAMKGIIFDDLSDIYGKEGMSRLRDLKFGDNNDLALNSFLDMIEKLNCQIKDTEAEIDVNNELDEDIILLMKMNGIGPYLALLIKSEIGNINRFSEPTKFISYCGLNPRVYQSGFKTRYGKISKQGSKWLRWAFVQATYGAVRCKSDNVIKKYYQSKKHKGNKKAVISTARYLAKEVYKTLKYKDHSSLSR
jgi:transposase